MERIYHAEFTALDGTVLTSGTPVVVHGFNIATNAADNGSLIQLINGTSGSGTVVIEHHLPEVDATLHTQSHTVMFPFGIVFPAGCFVTSGSIVSATVFYSKL